MRCVDCGDAVDKPHALPGTGDRLIDFVCVRCCNHCNTRKDARVQRDTTAGTR